MLDVTEVAECIVGNANIPELAILKRFAPREVTTATVMGNIINGVFDQLVAHPELSDQQAIKEAMYVRPLPIAAVGKGVDIDKVHALIPPMRSALSGWKNCNITVEPHVISNKHGLQGRFDILVENAEGVDLIELKAGTPPPSGIRPNHAAQAAAYALLYNELEVKPLKSVSLWYISDLAKPFRQINADDIHSFQQRVITVRDRIVELESQLAVRDFSILKSIARGEVTVSKFQAAFAEQFASDYANADATSRTLFQAWTSFLVSEAKAVRQGLDSSGRNTLTDLTIDPMTSDHEKHHFVFKAPQQIADISIREGDPVVIRRQPLSVKTMILKGAVRRINGAEMEVTIRNKQSVIDADSQYTIERDSSDASLRHLFPGIAQFLHCTETTRRHLLGETPVESPSKIEFTDTELLPDQQHAVSEALGSKHLHFIQGPPGTGKTSAVLRSIVSNLIKDPHERVLVIAYTNRAVSEICSVLPHHSFLRHGSKDGMLASHSHDNGIPFIAQELSPEQLAERIRDCRCIVSTVHSMHSSSEIKQFGEFTTLVVDEASQILDAQLIGLLSTCRRSILIGDQCQLPAVVTQQSEKLTVNSPLLQKIGVYGLGTSYFDRMTTTYQKNNWKGAISTLQSQGRMHKDVMEFPSQECYDGKLQTIHEWQNAQGPTLWNDLLPTRTALLPVITNPEHQARTEAELIVRVSTHILDSMEFPGQFSIGIITPFRTQNSLVLSMLPERVAQHVYVDTVERFQGSQRDVIIYGTTVCTPEEFESIRMETEVGNRMIDRKLNVASTRARHQFVLIGNPNILVNSPSYSRYLKHVTKMRP